MKKLSDSIFELFKAMLVVVMNREFRYAFSQFFILSRKTYMFQLNDPHYY